MQKILAMGEMKTATTANHTPKFKKAAAETAAWQSGHENP